MFRSLLQLKQHLFFLCCYPLCPIITFSSGGGEYIYMYLYNSFQLKYLLLLLPLTAQGNHCFAVLSFLSCLSLDVIDHLLPFSALISSDSSVPLNTSSLFKHPFFSVPVNFFRMRDRVKGRKEERERSAD